MTRELQAASFGAAAGVYARGRPGYPAAAVDWLLDGVAAPAPRVLDLGAGTGKLTAQLAQRGVEVIAVEPSAGMRAEFSRALPEVPVYPGSAEAIPLGGDSVDVVLVAQAWHWVDLAHAVPEVDRVLAPGGRLGLVWNTRDERADWVAELGHLLHGGVEQDIDPADPRVGAPFAPLEHFAVRWVQTMDRARLLDLVASRSYVITLEDEPRSALLERVGALFDRVAVHGEVAMPYVTRCSRTSR